MAFWHAHTHTWTTTTNETTTTKSNHISRALNPNYPFWLVIRRSANWATGAVCECQVKQWQTSLHGWIYGHTFAVISPGIRTLHNDVGHQRIFFKRLALHVNLKRKSIPSHINRTSVQSFQEQLMRIFTKTKSLKSRTFLVCSHMWRCPPPELLGDLLSSTISEAHAMGERLTIPVTVNLECFLIFWKMDLKGENCSPYTTGQTLH